MWNYDPTYDTNEYRYYKGYELDDVCSYDLTDREMEILDNAYMLVNNNWSLRELARNTSKSRSQLSRDFQGSLKRLSFELWQCVHRRYKEHYEKYFGKFWH